MDRMSYSLSFIDSHAHLTSSPVYEQIDVLLERAQKEHVHQIVNICTDPESLKKGIELSKKYPWIYQTAATPPNNVQKEGEAAFETIANYARKGYLKAIGETGLDYYYDYSSKEIQKDFFHRYLHLALECQLPVVIHCREAFADFFEIIDAEYRIDCRHAPGVLHCFTGTIAEAEEVIKRGWMLSLSGIVTFKKSFELQQVAKEVPLSQLLIETDTPYLAPQKYRGHPNEPSYIIETARLIASLKGISLEEVAHTTSENARYLFRI